MVAASFSAIHFSFLRKEIHQCRFARAEESTGQTAEASQVHIALVAASSTGETNGCSPAVVVLEARFFTTVGFTHTFNILSHRQYSHKKALIHAIHYFSIATIDHTLCKVS